MRKKTVVFRMPARFVVFRYKDLPAEWHVTCLESSAFGWGSSVEDAFTHLLKSVRTQFNEAAEVGTDAVFGGAVDSEWVSAFEEGRHPTLEDVIIAFSAEGDIEVSPAPRARARLFGPVRVRSTSAPPKGEALSA